MPNNFREGIYRAEFDTHSMQGIGLVVLRDGRVYGGDTLIYYVGTYSLSGNFITAQVKARPFKGMTSETIASVFGGDENGLELVGEIRGDPISLSGKSQNSLGNDIEIKLNFLHE
ncbi:GrlR family regulatory protein [Phyllobacterium sp. UNC302MFCol5.2]|uniref:GrlR family regulatory protein n=1 Tax=Phyllobacterium sp. UNC302MFCol5.2 TaxID=1449065 RepID=UPI0006901DA1|nr:GrlR family regulatory protein [Phyllobacterium sp. UNC302MFCol5.2]